MASSAISMELFGVLTAPGKSFHVRTAQRISAAAVARLQFHVHRFCADFSSGNALAAAARILRASIGGVAKRKLLRAMVERNARSASSALVHAAQVRR